MIPRQTFHVGIYELTCSARVRDNGSFEPTLVIARQAWPSRPRTIAVPSGTHATAETAIEAARQQGAEWVRDFG